MGFPACLRKVLNKRRTKLHYGNSLLQHCPYCSPVCSFIACSSLPPRAAFRSTPPAPGETPPISVLKPLCGLDEGLEENLRSFFVQDYPEYEVLLGVHTRGRFPAAALAANHRASIPAGKGAPLCLAESPIPMASFHPDRLVREPAHGLLVMNKSSGRARNYRRSLSSLAREFPAGERRARYLSLSRVPEKACGRGSKAIGMNTELWAGAGSRA